MRNVAFPLVLITMLLSCHREKVEPDQVLTEESMVAIADGFEDAMIIQGIDRTGKKDGFIRYGDVLTVDSLNVSGKSITSFRGIEYFVNLRTLTTFLTGHDSLDLSQNLKLEYLDCQTGNSNYGVSASMKYLNITECKYLKYLDCQANLLTSLDVSKNLALTYLNIGINSQIAFIDLMTNIELQVLFLTGCWKLKTPDISKNTKLRELYCEYNYLLESMDLSRHTELFIFNAEGCDKLNNLNFGSNPNLKSLNIVATNLASPDFNKTPNLTILEMGITKFFSVDLSPLKELKVLLVGFSQLTRLDLSKNVNLEGLDISGTVLTDINLDNNINLIGFYCQHQQRLMKVDLRQCKKLRFCYTDDCKNLSIICVHQLPVPSQNFSTSEETTYSLCKN